METITIETTVNISDEQPSAEQALLEMLVSHLERMERDNLTRLERIECLLSARPKVKEPERVLNTPAFMEVTGIGETKAREIFKNKELVRRGILIKDSSPSDKAGWLLRYDKWLKWANDNAKLALNV